MSRGCVRPSVVHHLSASRTLTRANNGVSYFPTLASQSVAHKSNKDSPESCRGDVGPSETEGNDSLLLIEVEDPPNPFLSANKGWFELLPGPVPPAISANTEDSRADADLTKGLGVAGVEAIGESIPKEEAPPLRPGVVKIPDVSRGTGGGGPREPMSKPSP